MEQITVKCSSFGIMLAAVNGIHALHIGTFLICHYTIKERFFQPCGCSRRSYNKCLRLVQSGSHANSIEIPVNNASPRRNLLMFIHLSVYHKGASKIFNALGLRNFYKHACMRFARSHVLHLCVKNMEAIVQCAYINHDRAPCISPCCHGFWLVVKPQPVFRICSHSLLPEYSSLSGAVCRTGRRNLNMHNVHALVEFAYINFCLAATYQLLLLLSIIIKPIFDICLPTLCKFHKIPCHWNAPYSFYILHLKMYNMETRIQ